MDAISAAIDWLVWVASQELLLFAAVGILLIGLDDLLFDLLAFIGWWKGDKTKHIVRAEDRAQMNMALKSIAHPAKLVPIDDGPIAIFLPAWQEYAVLPSTLKRMLTAWHGENFRIFVGCYPNDHKTIASIASLSNSDPRVKLVLADRDGPTTKGHNLNQLWAALGADERDNRQLYRAVVLHDAEDLVHPFELTLYRQMLPEYSMVQIPVHALIDPHSQWISGHYADEFAEAHGKELKLRSALGLPIPSAGVGCALSRDAISLLAMERDGEPFRPESLTEDYEIGILIGTYGLSARFVDAVTDLKDPIVSKGEFPNQLDAAVRQKARWITGIALAGWGQLGWPPLAAVSKKSGWINQLLSYWMLWRDRRAPLSGIVILAAYLGLSLALLHAAGRGWMGWEGGLVHIWLRPLIAANAVLLLWRLGVRCHFTTKIYGISQGLRAVPRAFIGNVIAIMAAYRALRHYFQMLRSGKVVWVKTQHGLAPRRDGENAATAGAEALP